MSAETPQLRATIFFSLLGIAVLAACGGDSGSSGNPLAVPSSANLTSGWGVYEVQCKGCHGADGTGNGISSRNLTDITAYDEETGTGYTFDSLMAKINDTMPEGSPAFCEGDCAEDTAAMILCDFNPTVTDRCGKTDIAIVVPAAANLAEGQISYDVLCVGCHLPNGMGTNNRDLTDLTPYDYDTGNGYTFESLTAKIKETMPKGVPVACEGACAVNTAAFILCSFDPEIAEGCP